MEKLSPAASLSSAPDRRAEVFARIEAELRKAEPALELERHDEGGLDPYNTLGGRIRRDVWGSRPR